MVSVAGGAGIISVGIAMGAICMSGVAVRGIGMSFSSVVQPMSSFGTMRIGRMGVCSVCCSVIRLLGEGQNRAKYAQYNSENTGNQQIS